LALKRKEKLSARLDPCQIKIELCPLGYLSLYPFACCLSVRLSFLVALFVIFLDADFLFILYQSIRAYRLLNMPMTRITTMMMMSRRRRAMVKYIVMQVCKSSGVTTKGRVNLIFLDYLCLAV
jgi:hypothetical protein